MPEHVRDSRLMSAPGRLIAGLAVALPLIFLLPGHVRLGVRLLAGWDAFAVTYLGLAWLAIWHMNAAEARSSAKVIDPSHLTALFIVRVAAIISFFSAVLVLHRLQDLEPAVAAAILVLGLSAILLSWTLTHTIYGLRYMHMYYGSGHSASGLDFPGDERPDGMDFQYFSFTIGMTYQVSDVTISHRSLRRVVLRHAILSFAYATVIIAMTINLIASRL
jgi:uncharacterized membrane protein